MEDRFQGIRRRARQKRPSSKFLRDDYYERAVHDRQTLLSLIPDLTHQIRMERLRADSAARAIVELRKDLKNRERTLQMTTNHLNRYRAKYASLIQRIKAGGHDELVPGGDDEGS